MSAHPDIPELAGTVPVVLYFGSQADADEFIAIVREAKPGLVARSLPPHMQDLPSVKKCPHGTPLTHVCRQCLT